jgi:hypothetical protein
LWPWTIVLTSIIAGAIVLLPIGATADRAIDSYVVTAGEFTFVRSAELGDMLDTALANEGLEESDVQESAVYEVRRGGDQVGAVAALAVDPEAAGSESFWDDFAAGLEESAGTGRSVQVAGKEATLVAAEGVQATYWHVDNLIIFAFAPDESTSIDIAATLRAPSDG